MTYWLAALLGLVQGLTEFLPVSSSGHLVIAEGVFGVPTEQGVLFSVLLHLGTLFPVTWFLRRPLLEVIRAALAPRRWLAKDDDSAALLRFVVLGTFVTTAVALPFKDQFEALFASPRAAALALLGTTAILFTSRWLPGGTNPRPSAWQAVAVGFAQAVAVTPGISRSGTTIVAGLAVRMTRESAGVASFLLSVPAILGGLVLELRHVGEVDLAAGPAILGVLVAAASGFLALHWTLRFLRHGRFWWFALWTLTLAALVLLFVADPGSAAVPAE